jgi:diguanylate cyclase (GGDEF)-like protein
MNMPLLSPELEETLRLCVNLPTLPVVALKVIEASKDPDISLHEVSSIISIDPAISAKLLKMANSPMYSQRRSVSNIREALTLLGFNSALTIALSFSLLHSLNNASNHKQNNESYWKRSILSAVIARLLGKQLGVARLEELFLAGLLQDIGILILDCVNDSLYSDKNKNGLKHNERVLAEKQLLGVEHSLVGAWLLKSWGLPERIVNAVMHSHSLMENISEENDADNDFYYCLNFSGVIADIWFEDDSNELLKSTMNAAQMFLSLDNAGFNKLLIDISNELPEVSSLFEINLIDEKERDRILDEARELLLERSIHFIKQSEDDRRQIENISAKVKEVEKINQLDHLTEVYNRRYIEQLLDEEYENANMNRWPLSLVLIDIDDFKLVNDTYGHLAGDEVIKFIATFFSKNIRETDVLARYGGDEFILMLPGATSDIAETLLKRLINSFKKEPGVVVKGEKLNITISVGLASHMDKDDFNNVKDFIQATDEALYKAKRSGKNCLAIY